MASSFVSRQRNQQRNTPPVAIKPFVRAAQNFALQTKQNREITGRPGSVHGHRGVHRDPDAGHCARRP
jgi:hypothetical protein